MKRPLTFLLTLLTLILFSGNIFAADFEDADITAVTKEAYTFSSEVNEEQTLAAEELIYPNTTLTATLQGQSLPTDDKEAADLLDAIAGTYQPLFESAIFNTEYDHYWYDYSAAVVGELMADAVVTILKNSVSGTVYGASYQPTSLESAQFYCGFTGGVATITFNGTQISGHNVNGNEIFSHQYRYIGKDDMTYGGESVMQARVFQSIDNNDDEFKYFFLCDDTPGTTYHIEFRYGKDREALRQGTTGDYAYWLAAGIPTDALTETSEKNIANVIALFCIENLAEMTTAETKDQRGDFIGTWEANGLPELSCAFDAEGNGKTYYNGEVLYSYTFYAYDNDGIAETSAGVYLVLSDDDGTEASTYAIVTTDDKTVITFYALDGEQISFTKQVSNAPDGSASSGSGGSSSSSSISLKTADYSLADGGTISVTLTKGNYSLSKITYNGNTLNEGTDYTVSGTKYTFTEDFLHSLGAGNHIITFDMSSGTDPVLAITVTASSIMQEPQPLEWVNPFFDVSTNDWFYSNVKHVYDNEIMAGTSATTFSPNAKVTRGMTATVLWRMAGSPSPRSSNPFTDMAQDWYSSSVAWAAEAGIVSGYSSVLFGPEDSITREQMMTMFYRYMIHSEKNYVVTEEYIIFNDESSISDWAKNAVQVLYKLDIVSGVDDNTIAPQNTATRAELATILHGFMTL